MRSHTMMMRIKKYTKSFVQSAALSLVGCTALPAISLAGNQSVDVNAISSEAMLPARRVFDNRLFPKTYVFNDRLWVAGGVLFDASSHSSESMLDIWSSADGSRWQLGGVFYEFLQYQPEIAELNGKLFAISGFGPDGCSQDVWSSENGVDWLLEGQTNDSQTCSFMKVVEFNDKLWAIGTFGSFDDIWSSDDGLKWVLETDDAAFPARNMGASVTVSDGKLWVAGGYLEGEYFNDVWSSVDGVTWVEEVGNANFPPSTGLLTNSEGKLYYQVLGKDDAASDVIEIWSSYDGIYWVQEVITPSVSSRVAHALTDFDGRIWMLGGADWSDPFEYDLKNDYVWSSPDGSSWTLHHIPKPSLR